MTFESRIVWITGASSGIGQSLAMALLHRGASVIVSGRRDQASPASPQRLPSTLVLPFEATAFDTLSGVVDRCSDPDRLWDMPADEGKRLADAR